MLSESIQEVATGFKRHANTDMVLEPAAVKILADVLEGLALMAGAQEQTLAQIAGVTNPIFNAATLENVTPFRPRAKPAPMSGGDAA